MNINELRGYINSHSDSIAFIVGNGINRFNSDRILSWDDLLQQLWHRVTDKEIYIRPTGISLTEFYDILELKNNDSEIDLQKIVSQLLENWSPLQHHNNIVNKIRELNAPLLTTNFDEVLAHTSNMQTYNLEWTSDFYPWSTYHGPLELSNPLEGFGIWYINGMRKYHRSIRLGLTHYMGSVERSRRLIHNGDDRLFNGKAQHNWKGKNTWLHIVFNKELIVFGLGLEENETFLRWLLIERKRYFREFPEREFNSFYLHVNEFERIPEGKRLFLESVGFKVIEIDRFENLYTYLWT
ncbi:hypothetical protein [Sphingobacterium paramultivorum]|uniref:hypothetical protein n=1 Tax=Sphingobacterium paramultivorum TaxID=2886510 RepID=UPI00129C3F2E|nr:hypothetical protein [Sphingobacterium paramultivorum]